MRLLRGFPCSKNHFFLVAYSSILKGEAAGSSSTLAAQPISTWHHNPKAGPTASLSLHIGPKSSMIDVYLFISFHFPDMNDFSIEALCVDRYSDEAYY
jgi:hypothetical protein